jgi:hypothetical protein
MDRDIPAFNRVIMDKIYFKNHQLHQQRLITIKVIVFKIRHLKQIEIH